MPSKQGRLHPLLAKSGFTWHLIINDEKEVLYCSPTCEDITGYPPELFLQNHGYIERIIHPADKDCCPTQFAGDTKENYPRKNEYRIIARSGDVKWLASYIKPILLEDEDHTYTLISNLDITPYREKIFRLKKENETIRNDIIKNIYPIIEELKNLGGRSSIGMLTENLLFRMDELCQSLDSGHSAYFGKYLSATELKVALFIKEGLSSNEIARQLTISVATVKTHRKNIRRKLKIQNSKINLSSYLKLKWHHHN